MKRSKIIRLIVQGAASLCGLLGLVWVFMGLRFGITGIRDADAFSMYYMLPMFVILGGIVMVVAWRNIRHFGPSSIRAIVGLLAFAVYSSVSTLLRLCRDATWDLNMELHHSATFLIPMLLAFLLYRVVSRKLIELTDTEGIQPKVGRVSSESAPSASPDEPSR